MPIPIEEFKLDEDHQVVLNFLRMNPDKGYTEEEIIIEINEYIFSKIDSKITDYEKPKILELFGLNRILVDLINSGHIRKIEKYEKEYFSYK